MNKWRVHLINQFTKHFKVKNIIPSKSTSRNILHMKFNWFYIKSKYLIYKSTVIPLKYIVCTYKPIYRPPRSSVIICDVIKQNAWEVNIDMQTVFILRTSVKFDSRHLWTIQHRGLHNMLFKIHVTLNILLLTVAGFNIHIYLNKKHKLLKPITCRHRLSDLFCLIRSLYYCLQWP